MTADWFSGHVRRLTMVGALLALAAPLGTHTADARSRNGGSSHASTVRSHSRAISYGMTRYASWSGGGRLQCVPFARENSGIELSGNAATWWNAASGVYERGQRPEVGSVLNFRANGRMRMGHVAVVSNVIDGRNVEIDHANWGGPGVGRGGITRNMHVVDVSPYNDWSAVRLSLGNGDYGSVYPTYGFIYDRPDRGTMIANTGVASGAVSRPVIAMNAAPRDLRPASDRIMVSLSPVQDEEVAEAGDDMPRTRRTSSRHGHASARVIRGATVQHVSSHGRGVTIQRVSAHTPAHATPARTAPKHGRHRT